MKALQVFFLNFIFVAVGLGAEPPSLSQILDKCIRPWRELKPDRQPLFLGYLKNVEGFWFMHKGKIYFAKKPAMAKQDFASQAQPAGKLALPEDDVIVGVIYYGEEESSYKLGITPLGTSSEPGWEPKKSDFKPTEYLTAKHVPAKSPDALLDFQLAAAKEAEGFAENYVWGLAQIEMKRGVPLTGPYDKEFEQRILVQLGAEVPQTVLSQFDACLDTLGSEGQGLRSTVKDLESKRKLWDEAHTAGLSVIEQLKGVENTVGTFFRP